MTIGQDQTQAVTAFSRFGLGPRPGDLARAARDPRGVLVDELRTANVALIRNGALPGGVAALQADYLDQQARRIERQKMAMAPAVEKVAADPQPKPQAAKPAPPKPNVEQALFRAEAGARAAMQLQAPAGFVERLVAFWSNHFAVSVAKSRALLVLAGPFQREAVRPNVLGKFSTLLRAAESHPAMILFLDNQRSIGPNAAAGKFAGAG